MDTEHCKFFVQRKKRFCRMTVKKGHKYCGEHMEADVSVQSPSKRIPCPLDSTHTCFESRLKQHLEVCNVKKLIDARPECIIEGINRGEIGIEAPKHVPLTLLDQNVVDDVIKKVEAAADKLPKVEELILEHDILSAEINNSSYGNYLKKHLIQNSSLLAHLNRAGLLKENSCFIEFGAGKGKLTYWLAQLIKNTKDSTVILVDRSSHRHKNDNKLKTEDCSINIVRIRADIADLCLNKIEEVKNSKYTVGIAKHLCGAATDLTLRCLTNQTEDTGVSGLIIAFCCHHRCEYISYVGKKYLKECGFTPEEFPILCSIASWATCGTGKNRQSNSTDKESSEDMKRERRESIGRKVKSLLNWGRIKYLDSMGFDSKLYYYTRLEVSLENMCVVATRKINI
ncbi:tRNA:m(4)X modification enzyme TRM13 homolog [Microplitis mediator]|uniref:tRNA:m(4)X modification enzyme TRM13 homolog n=1 Tax=Microplitis mediator TaxID=375433 RepID=UPI0025558314|nr:tRNA:m(4)X modification enzyme TRM13 homolog [Microplitis mediator]